MKNVYQFSLVDDDYEKYNDFFLSHLPNIKTKFREQLCVTGKKINYEDISKVNVLYKNNKLITEPVIFSKLSEEELSKSKELDYIGIYSIGILELLYLVFSKDLTMANVLLTELKHSINIFDDYNDISNTLNIIALNIENDLNSKYLETFNIFFAMRTDYNKEGYDLFKQLMSVLMIIWLKNKAQYWNIFFEIMDFCKPIYEAILEEEISKEVKYDQVKNTLDDIINNSDDKELKALIKLLGLADTSTENIYKHIKLDISWLDKENDLHFEKIKYKDPNTNTYQFITDCRGVAIYLTLKLYLYFLSEYGYMNSNSSYPIFDYKDSHYLNVLDNYINNCIGNDIQSKVLRGIKINNPCQMNARGSYIYDEKNCKYITLNDDTAILKDYYEDCILFKRAYYNSSSKIEIKKKNIFMNYSNIDTLYQAIGYILFTGHDLLAFDTSEYDKQIASLENTIKNIQKENNKLKATIEDLKTNTTNIEELEHLQNELNKTKELVESKSIIIDQLLQKNKSLSDYISNIYNEEDIEKEIELKELIVSQDEMIKCLNDFKFILIGGRIDLLQKVNELGWTNVIQYDKNNRSKLSGSIPQSDFYVVNTKFLSHALVNQMEKNENIKDTMIYFNGTNINFLIYSCYKFVQAYFK